MPSIIDTIRSFAGSTPPVSFPQEKVLAECLRSKLSILDSRPDPLTVAVAKRFAEGKFHPEAAVSLALRGVVEDHCNEEMKIPTRILYETLLKQCSKK